MQQKIQQIIFDIEIILFELVALVIPFTERELLSSGVNMLTNSLKISYSIKTELSKMMHFQIDQKIWEKYFPADLSNLLEPLTCSLSISVLTRGFLGVYVTLLFAVYNVRNK